MQKIARIIPLIRLPEQAESSYDYLVPDGWSGTLEAGCLVVVPFRSRNKPIRGVVESVKRFSPKQNKRALKSIIAPLHPRPLVTGQQMKLAKDLASFSRVSLASAMKAIAPGNIPKKYNLIDATKNIVRNNVHTLRSSTKKRTRYSAADKTVLFQYDSWQQRDRFICEQMKQRNGTLLVLVPEISDVEYFDTQAWNTARLVHSRIAPAEYFDQWLALLGKHVPLVVGTKKALFLPFCGINAIIIDQEHSANLDNTDQKPYYRAQDIAERLAKYFRCPLVLASYAPKVKTWEKAKYGIYNKVQSPKSKVQSKSIKISLIDMNEEIRKENFSPFSDTLHTAIEQTEDGNIFLFLNRKGFSTFIMCKDCEHIFECQQCKKPLIEHKIMSGPESAVYEERASSLRCHSCGHQEDTPPLCPECGGAELKFAGKGTQKIEALLKKEFSERNIVRIDSDNQKIPKATFHLPHTIFIGTEYALSRIPWHTIALVGVLNVDPMLSLPDPKAHERVYQLLRKIELNMHMRSSPHQSGGIDHDRGAKIIIQTFSPALPVFSSLVGNNPEAFYESEINMSEK